MVGHPTILFRSTIGAALLSALLLSTPAQAGLLGGGGGRLAGGFGGGLNGALTPRSLNVGGEGTGTASRNGASLPRGEKATQKAGEAVRGTKEAGAAGTNAIAPAADAPSSPPAPTGSSAKSGSLGGQGSLAATTRGADASAHGSAQASRADRSVSADTSAQGSASR
jgi:hypothetical protein